MAAVLGAVSALAFYAQWQNGETELAFAHNIAFEILFVAVSVGVPLFVGRWWIASAIAGPLGFLIFWQVMGHYVYADGHARPLNIESVSGMFWYVVWWEILTAARKGWDKLWAWRTGRRSNESGLSG